MVAELISVAFGEQGFQNPDHVGHIHGCDVMQPKVIDFGVTVGDHIAQADHLTQR